MKHPADLASVSKEDAERAYSMDEVIRIINAWKRNDQRRKEHFPQSQIINIEEFKDDKEILSKNEQMKEIEAEFDKQFKKRVVAGPVQGIRKNPAHQELKHLRCLLVKIYMNCRTPGVQ